MPEKTSMKIQFKKGYILVVSEKLIYFIGYISGVGKTAKGGAFFPFIFVKSDEFAVNWLITHERIHFRQQLETLFIGFILISLFEKAYAYFILKKSWFDSYLWSSGEQEAYLNMYNNDYLQNRKPWAQFYYFRHKKNFILTGPGQIKFI